MGLSFRTWLPAIGEITNSTPGVFGKALARMGKKKLPIVITSLGSAIKAAIEIGSMVRKRGIAG